MRQLDLVWQENAKKKTKIVHRLNPSIKLVRLFQFSKKRLTPIGVGLFCVYYKTVFVYIKKLDKNSKAEEVYSKNISNLDYRGNSHK